MATSDPTPTQAPVAVLEYEHSPLEQLLIQHRKKLLLVGAIALLGTGAYLGNNLWKSHKTSVANLTFTRAASLEELRKAAQAYEGTPAGGSAMMETARLLEQEGRPMEAIDELRKFLAKYGAPGAHPLQDFAKFRLADLLAANNRVAEAEPLYREVAGTSPAFPQRAKLRMADQLLAMDKKDEARAKYEELSKLKSAGEIADIAKERLNLVKRVKPTMIPYVEEKPPATPPGTPGATPGTTGTPDNPFGSVQLTDPSGAPAGSLLDAKDLETVILNDPANPAGTPLPPADGAPAIPPVETPAAPADPAPATPAPAEGAKKQN